MRIWYWILGVLAVMLVVLVAVVYFVFDPSQMQLFPKCSFLALTGWKCPGCGGQRMLHALLHGDIVGAFRYNAYVMTVFPLLGLMFLLEHFRERYPRLYVRSSSIVVGAGFLVVTLLWWWLRNVFDW